MSTADPGRDGGHILVDFDGTLAEYSSGGYAPGKLGEPIGVMVSRVWRWLDEGRSVIIFTARVHQRLSNNPEKWEAERTRLDIEHRAIRAWCRTHLGQELPITCVKISSVDAIYDDRAFGVEHNTGRILALPDDWQGQPALP